MPHAAAVVPTKKASVSASSGGDYGAAVLDALRNMNKSSTQALTSVKAPGTINPVIIGLFTFSFQIQIN